MIFSLAKKMKYPFWITNFKNYESSTGEKALFLAKIHERVAQETGKNIGIAVSAFDVFRISQSVKIPILTQHIDPVEFGATTGYLLPQGAKMAGASGTLLNHSERRLGQVVLEASSKYAKECGLLTVVCAESPEEVKKLTETLSPDIIAYEPPELIGSSTLSVATAHPKSIQESVALAGEIPLLVGAGINSPKDIEVSLELGAKGFLVASAITKAEDPEKILKTLVSIFP